MLSIRPLMHWSFRSFILGVLTVFLLAVPTPAAEKYGNSLDWAPADAAFYSSSMRLKDQIDIVAKSNAWKKFLAIPTVDMAWQMTDAQLNNPNGPAAMFLQLLELPENQQLLQMFGDMFSQEVVVFGGPTTADFVQLYGKLSSANTLAKVEAGPGDPAERRDAQARLMLKALQENKELIKAPNVVLAFKLVDKQAAETQLKRLEVLARIPLKQTPYADRFKREKVDGIEYLTLKLDGSLVPWDNLPWASVEQEEGEFKELRATLEKLTLVISLGVRNDYLIFSIDQSTDGLAKLGKTPALADRKEFAALAKFRDRKLSSIGYVSDAFAKRAQMSSADIDQVIDQVGGILDAAGVEDQKLKDRIAGDIEKLGDDVKKLIPTPGATMGFSFMTPTGFEGYSYNWTQQVALDGSKPLPLANHLGGKPILAIVSRAKYNPQAYDTLTKWAKIGFSYFEEFAIPQMGGDEREKTAQVIEIAKPLLARADKATRELLVPSLKDGQAALVLDAQIASKQWHKDMPASSRALPMAELALVMGVSDPKLFSQAMTEYRAIADDLVKKVREKNPDAIPADYKVPLPKSETAPGGTVYTYRLPDNAGLDQKIAPAGGLGENLAVLATSPRLAAKVLGDMPLPSQGLIGSNAGKPCATMIYFNWSALVEAATPWIEFAIRQKAPGAEGAETEEDPAQIKEILDQVRTGMDLLKCWRSTEVVSTIEDGVTIGHSVTTFKDAE